MRIPKTIAASLIIIVIAISIHACSKADGPTPDPTPVVLPDTLGPGWTKKVFPGEQLSDVFFNTATNGYMPGSKLYRSSDGGISWAGITVANPSLINAFVTNDGKAFFATASNNIIKTLDGGVSFQQFSISDNSSDVFFTDNSNGYSTTQSNGLFQTTDGGVTWSKVITTGLNGTPGYSSLYFANNSTGWIVTSQKILKTNGSISTWQESSVSGGTTPYGFVSVYAPSASTVFAGSNGEIFKSTDGGANFSFIKKLANSGLTDIHFFDELSGYASADKSIFKTTDGGVNWTKVASRGQGYIVEIHFTDPNHGWACGDSTLLIFKQ